MLRVLLRLRVDRRLGLRLTGASAAPEIASGFAAAAAAAAAWGAGAVTLAAAMASKLVALAV